MIRNFFTIAFRNLFKHKVFSAINIFGLAIGIAACLLILQYVRFELSYDRFEQHAGLVFRLQQDRYNDGKLSTNGQQERPASVRQSQRTCRRSNPLPVSARMDRSYLIMTAFSGKTGYITPVKPSCLCSAIPHWKATPEAHSKN